MANDKRACEPAGMAAIYKPDPRLRRVARHLGMRERTRDVVKIAQSVRKATFPKRAGPSVTVADLVAPWRPGRPPQAEGQAEGLPHFERSRLQKLPNRPRRLPDAMRSEEHTSELQSLKHTVCRLLL